MSCKEVDRALNELRELRTQGAGENGCRRQRHQSDDRTNLQGYADAVGATQHVVEETVLLVPKADSVTADMVGGRGNPREVLQQRFRLLDVHRVLVCQFERNLQHVLAVKRHPRGAVGLVETPAARKRCAAVEDSDVVEAEETALEDVAIISVFAVQPPIE